MADDTSRHFDLAPQPYLSFFSCKYQSQQYHSTWTPYHPPSNVTSSVIYVLWGQLSLVAMFQTPGHIPCTNNWCPTTITLAPAIDFKILSSQPSRSFRYVCTMYVTANTLNNLVFGYTQLRRCGELLPRSTYWKNSVTPANLHAPTTKTLTNASLVCFGNTLTRTLHRNEKR